MCRIFFKFYSERPTFNRLIRLFNCAKRILCWNRNCFVNWTKFQNKWTLKVKLILFLLWILEGWPRWDRWNWNNWKMFIECLKQMFSISWVNLRFDLFFSFSFIFYSFWLFFYWWFGLKMMLPLKRMQN